MVMLNSWSDSTKKYLRPTGLVLQIALGLIGLYWVVQWSGISFDRLITRISKISALPLCLGIVFFCMSAMLNALRYSLFFGRGISFRYLTGLYFFQNALVTFIPWRIGEISYPLLLHRDYGVSLTKSVAVLLLIRLLDLVILMCIVLIGGFRFSLPGIWIWVAVIVGLIVCGILYLMWRKSVSSKVNDIFKQVWAILQPLGSARIVIFFMGTSLSLAVTTAIQTWMILKSISFSMNFLDVLVFNAITLLAGVIPIHPPGGWGTIDSIQSITLTTMGYQMSEAVTSVLVAHSIYSVLIFAGGLAGWIIRKNALGK